MSLYLIQASLQLQQLSRWAGRRQLMPATFDEGYALHCLLNSSFGEGVIRPFRLMYVRGATEASLYGYSKIDHLELKIAAASYAEPDYSSIVSDINSKAMPTVFAKGRTLGFDLKIRPVRRSRQHEGGSPQERDAYQIAAIQQEEKEKNSVEQLSRESVYRDWLGEKMANNGAELSQQNLTNMVSFQRTQAIRRAGQRKGTEGPEAIMQGELTVNDPEIFQQLLYKGLGRHCGYGYGMLLLRPPRRG